MHDKTNSIHQIEMTQFLTFDVPRVMQTRFITHRQSGDSRRFINPRQCSFLDGRNPRKFSLSARQTRPPSQTP